MNYTRHPHTVKDLAHEIKKIVDDHKNKIISDQVLEDTLLYWSAYEVDKLYDGNNLRRTIVFIIGSRREAIVKKILGGFPTGITKGGS
ncbi:TIGR04540 family protein [Aminobacterium colombiense]|jgi:uncharacterized protein (TIGR04540 family)|uniref:TIGR04540 family protein n=1 Tax=Aminobacterium colombiense TaxID=81468 RepID=UPI002596573C|nr:TIGR04540 family protein [uncultured Aminobacterium sp.]